VSIRDRTIVNGYRRDADSPAIADMRSPRLFWKKTARQKATGVNFERVSVANRHCSNRDDTD